MTRKLFILLALCVTGAIVAYRLSGGGFNWPLFYSSLWSLRFGWLAASIVATFVTYILRAVRWQVLITPIKKVPFDSLLAITMLGFSAIYILGRAGELARPLLLSRRENVSLSASFATIIIERFFDSAMLVGLFVCALLTVELPSSSAGAMALMKNAAWLIVAVSIGAIMFLVLLRSNIDRIVRWIKFPRVASLAQNFSDGLSFLKNGRGLAMTMVHSITLWTAIALQFWFMLLGMNFSFSINASTLIMVGAAIGSIAQIPGIGGGFQAGFVFCITTFFKVPAEKAIAASLIAWVFNYVPTVAAGAIYMVREGISVRDLKNTIRNPQSETV